MGGEPTAVQLAIVEEAAGLIVWCRQARTALLKGNSGFDVGAYTTGVNSLRRLLCDLGQDRRLKDVTIDLKTYLEETATASTTAANGNGTAKDATAEHKASATRYEAKE